MQKFTRQNKKKYICENNFRVINTTVLLPITKLDNSLS